MPRLRLFAILCFDSQERREAPRLVYRLDTRGAGLYRRQPVTVPPVPCHLRLPDLMVAQTHTRASLFSFSRQMQGSREPLVSLLEGLLDGENMNVMLRGVYLTSSLQRGQMDDIFTQSAARQYRLGNNPLASWPLVDTAPYFTRSLFPQALLAEPNLATESRAWLIRSRRRLTVFSATGGVAALLLITGWHHYYNGTISPASPCLSRPKPLWTCRLRRGKMTLATCNCRS